MLEGKLVRLRALDMSDLDRYVEWMNDREVKQHLSSQVMYPISRASEEQWLQQAMREIGGEGFALAIEVIEGDRHIGTISLHDVRPNNRKAVLGIMIGDKTCWDRGYGTDAIRTLLRFAFDEMNLYRVSLTVNADNTRGIACYRKCGFVEEGRLRADRFSGGVYSDTLVMSILEPEYRKTQETVAST